MIVLVCREKNVLYNKIKKLWQSAFQSENDVAYPGGFNAMTVWKTEGTSS